jgi:hypothetical protein
LDLEGDPAGAVTVDQEMAVPQHPMGEVGRCPVEDDHVERTAEELLQVAGELDAEARGRLALLEHGDVDVTPAVRGAPRHAPEQVGRGDPLALGLPAKCSVRRVSNSAVSGVWRTVISRVYDALPGQAATTA